jgi:polyribonucleotide nucleotidyltransferase
MDAGVPLKAPVAGVAMGLVKEGDDYAILTDIAGAEDHYGDMDFKVAGTRDGITALQMDIKIGGITAQIMREALEQARRGRLFILDKMNEVIQTSRTELSEFAPRFYTLQIPPDKIRDLIGPGGKVIRGIVEQTGVKIDVEDSGKVNVASSDQEAAKQALKMIQDITATAEVGKTYLGTVTRLAEFGAFVEIIPGTDGLLHISEVAEHRIKDVKDELHEGDQVLVKVLAVDGNRIKLSRKAVLKEQRAKMGGGDGAEGAELATAEAGAPGGVTFEGGYEGGPEEEQEGEPNFNRDDAGNFSRPPSGGDRGPRPHGGGGGGGRGGRGRRPGGGGGGRPGGGGGGRHGGGGGRGR